MRQRNSPELSAIPMIAVWLVGSVLLIIAVFTARTSWLLAAVPVLAIVALVAWALRGRHRADAGAAPARRKPTPDSTHRLLVIADDSCTSAAFRELIVSRAVTNDSTTEVFVVAPALSSRLARWTGDEDAYRDARRHLDETLEALADVGVEAHGAIGPHDPIQAADDGLREFAADEVVFATHSDVGANWLEADVVETARSRYHLPVTHIGV